MFADDGPRRGKILDMRKPRDGQLQILVGLIWHRESILKDLCDLDLATKQLNKVWPKEASFKYMLGTEFRLAMYSCISNSDGDLDVSIEKNLCQEYVYHRPWDPSRTKFIPVGKKGVFFCHNAPFHRMFDIFKESKYNVLTNSLPEIEG